MHNNNKKKKETTEQKYKHARASLGYNRGVYYRIKAKNINMRKFMYVQNCLPRQSLFGLK
uniref:60S ribosomal protein L35a n=1 Tax=Heterorhabditis bacteriophora TaxID=37862 RepID=A0A1I7WGV6_HETBA